MVVLAVAFLAPHAQAQTFALPNPPCAPGTPGAPPNDCFSAAIPVAGNAYSNAQSTVGATKETFESNPNWGISKTVWYAWTPSITGAATVSLCGSDFDTVVGIWTGSQINALTFVASDGQGCAPASTVDFSCVAGTTYMVQAGSWLNSVPGNLQVSFSCVPPCQVVANDCFDTAVAVNGNTYSTVQGTVGASLESGEPTPGPGYPISKSVWYAWTPTTTGTAYVATCGPQADFDTFLAVYTGSAVGALTQVVYNDRACGPWNDQSYVEFPCVAGTTYRIQAASSGSAPGGTLHMAMGCHAPCASPANDCIANAQPANGDSFLFTESVLGASTEPGEPTSPSWALSNTVWFDWTPASSGAAVASTCGSDYDTYLAVYTGADFASFSYVADAEDGCDRQSYATFPCVAGTTYRIQVGGQPWSHAAALRLTLACNGLQPPGCGYTAQEIPYDFEDIDPAVAGGGTGVPNLDTTAMALVPDPPMPFHLCGDTYQTFWLSSKGNVCLDPAAWLTGDMVDYPDDCPAYWSIEPLPDRAAPDAVVYGYWADLYPGGCPGGDGSTCQFYKVEGTAPERTLVVEWKGVPYYDCCYPDDHTFELKFFEDTGCIEAHYQSVTTNGWQPSTAGFENRDSSDGWTYRFDPNGFSIDHRAWRTCPVPHLRAMRDDYTLNEDSPAQVLDVLSNDITNPPEPLTILTATSPTKGTLQTTSTSIAYTPAPDAVGADEFTYTVRNATGGTSTAKVSLTLQAVNDAPTMQAHGDRILVTPSDGPQAIAGWAWNVTQGPATAVDEAPQAVTFVVASDTAPVLFAEGPTVERTATADATQTSGADQGAFGVLRFAPSGATGTALVCFQAQDDGGTAPATDSWGRVATGHDASGEHCVEVVVDEVHAYFEASTRTPFPRTAITFDPCPAPAPRCSVSHGGALVRYLWEFGDGASSTETSPVHAFATAGRYVVRLTVWDGYGVSASEALDILVANPVADGPSAGSDGGRTPPVADVRTPLDASEGLRVQLSAAAPSDARDPIFAWTQLAGPRVELHDAETAQPWFTAPWLAGGTPADLVFAVRVTDGGVVGPPAFVVVHVHPSNAPPVADAGPDLQAAPGALVALDGGRSTDPDGDALTYHWSIRAVPGEPQVAQAQVDDADAATPTVRAPAAGTVWLELEVSDGRSASRDTVAVTALPPSQAEATPPRAAPVEPHAPVATQEARASWMPIVALGAALAASACVVAWVVVRRSRRSQP